MICLIGESGSGKSTIEREICRRFGLKKVVSYTTRPMRDGEVDGYDYHFVSEDKFKQMEDNGEFAETTVFRDWHYGATIKDVVASDVFVIEPIGLRKLLGRRNELGVTIIPIYICVPERSRMIRMLQRGDNIDEVMRRVGNDRETFKGVNELVEHTVFNSFHSSFAVDEVMGIYRMGYRKDD